MNRYRLVAGAAITIFSVLLWIGGEDVSADWVRWVSLATLIAVWIETTYEKWLWAVIPIRRSRWPDLRGTWKGTLTTEWVDKASGEMCPPKDCYLVIGQTASTIRVALLADESRSKSSAAGLFHDDVVVTLQYIFRNQPKIRVDGRSAAHHGAVTLDVSSTGTRLEGHYWTDRNSRGELTFSKRKNGRVTTYTDASELEW